MDSLIKKFQPVLSTPFGHEGYREIAPCDALKPFVSCFWEQSRINASILVIPDARMDIIFDLGGNGGDFFCALDESSYYSNGGSELFGARFYAWTAGLLLRRDFTRVEQNQSDIYFNSIEELRLAVRGAQTFEERVSAVENCLIKRIDGIRADNNLLNAVDFIVDNHGTANISELCMHTAVSARTLERLFNANIGASPKMFSSLVRYQMLWRDMVRGRFDVLDAVEKYGYSDQSHLLNDFKKRHLMNPRQALDYAKKFQNVVFLQDKSK